MTGVLLPNGEQYFADNNGAPLAGGKVYFYVPNTLVSKNTWQDQGQTAFNTNPVILDASGRAIIYGLGNYRQIVKDADGNLIWDQLTSSGAGGGTGGSGVFLSNFLAYDDPLAAANTSALLNFPSAPIINVDVNYTLTHDYTGSNALGSTLNAVGGILTTGTFALTCLFASGPVALFDTAGTGVITFSAPTDWIEGIWFNPPFNGFTDCINAFNRWKGSCTDSRPKFRWPPGYYHTAYTNKFLSPKNLYATIDFSGVRLDSTFVYEGDFQTYINWPSIGSQVRLALTSVTGAFTPGGKITIGNSTEGVILAWDGSSVLNVGNYLGFGNSSSIAVGHVVTDATTSGHGTISIIGYQIGCAAETGYSGAGTSRSFTQWGEYNGSCVMSYSWIGHTIGLIGTNTDGTTTPAIGYQAMMSQQDCSFPIMLLGPCGLYGFAYDSLGSGSFCNDNVFNSLSSSNNADAGGICNGSNYNTYIGVDMELNGGTDCWVVNNSGAVLGGLLQTSVVGGATLNYTATATELRAWGMRFADPCRAKKTLTIVGITQSAAPVLTYSGTDPANGQFFAISGATGMTQVNGLLVKVANLNTGAKTMSLKDAYGNFYDTSSYPAYTASSGSLVAGNPFDGVNRQAGFTGFNNLGDMDNITVRNDVSVAGELIVTGDTYIPNPGLSTFPPASITFTLGAGGTTGHTLSFDMTNFPAADSGMVRVTATPVFNFSTSHLGGISTTFGWWKQVTTGTLQVIGTTTGGFGTATVTSVTAVGNAAVITFDTSSAITVCYNWAHYGDRLNTNLG